MRSSLSLAATQVVEKFYVQEFVEVDSVVGMGSQRAPASSYGESPGESLVGQLLRERRRPASAGGQVSSGVPLILLRLSVGVVSSLTFFVDLSLKGLRKLWSFGL